MIKLDKLILFTLCIFLVSLCADVVSAGELVPRPRYNYRVHRIILRSNNGGYYNRSNNRQYNTSLLSTGVAKKFNPLKRTKRGRNSISKSELPILNYIKAQRKYKIALAKWRLDVNKRQSKKKKDALRFAKTEKKQLKSGPGHSKFGKSLKFTLFPNKNHSKEVAGFSGKRLSIWERIKKVFAG